MYKLEDILQVHLEITELCQATCPMCPRTDGKGGINPHLSMAELTLEDCKKIFPPSFLKQLRSIYLCGNFGDPIIAKDTLDILRYFREHNQTMWLDLHTNGGARNTEWWTKLVEIQNNRGKVIFGIDGLKDTNHIYRRGVNWDIVENSAKAYIGAGGRAEWQFLIFAHNEHQIDDAEKLSKEWGFSKFRVRKTSRFSTIEHQISTVGIYNKQGAKIDTLAKPSEKFQNAADKEIPVVLSKYKTTDSYYKNVPIQCKALTYPKIFVSAEGLMLPCCWISGPLYCAGNTNFRDNELWRLIDQVGGKEKLDARNGLQAVFDSGIFELIETAWNAGEGRLKVCAQMCATEYNPLDSQ